MIFYKGTPMSSRGLESLGESRVSQQLLGAALAGLMGASLVSCGKDKEKIVEVAPAAPIVLSKTTDKSITLATFTSTCTTRGGLVQTHASCGGSNFCAGVSFNSGVLIEHTCKASNTCAGYSCVDLPKDAGLTGAQVLAGPSGDMESSAAQCNFCHGTEATEFQLRVKPGTTDEAAKAAFAAKSDAALVTAVAFGLHGVNADGSAYANMPGFYTRYSRAEILRLVAHLKTLTVTVKEWKDPQ